MAVVGGTGVCVRGNQVLLGYKPLESSSFGDRTEMLGGYMVFQTSRASKYLEIVCLPVDFWVILYKDQGSISREYLSIPGLIKLHLQIQFGLLGSGKR